jgi:DNA-binding NarL/FixJ family response regulator
MQMYSKSSTQTRLLLVDDHLLFREGLVRLLATESEFELVAQCSTVLDAFSVLKHQEVDLVLLDFDLGEETGSSFVKWIRAAGYTTKILVVTAGISPLDAHMLHQDGIAGIFYKHGSPATLLDAIRTVASNRVWSEPREVATQDLPSPHPDTAAPLTQREQDVLRCVFEGLINKQIAIRIGVSESSVKATLQQLFDKTGVRTRSQLVRFALERSLAR